MKKIIEEIINGLSDLKKGRRLIHVAIVFSILIPILIISIFGLLNAKKQLTKEIFESRQSLSSLAQVIVKGNLDNLIDLGNSLSTRVILRKLISEGKWSEGVDILKSVPTDFPIIERVFITDPSGVLKADYPALPGVAGRSFAFRDWYRGVSKNWQPYVSEVYKRAAEPQYNVVAVAIPIKADSGEVAGILVMQIKLDYLFKWTSDIKIGSTSFIYIVDQANHIIIHPKFDPQDEIIDFSGTSVVKTMREQGKGIIISFNQIENEEQFAAFESMPKYGWGVVVQAPITSIFAGINKELASLSIFYGLIFLLSALLAYFLLRILHMAVIYRRKEQIFLESVGDGLVGIDRLWNIILWNNAATQISGWTKEEVMGKPLRNFLKFIREYDRSENTAFIEEAIIYGKVGYLENNTFLIVRSGKEIPVGDSAAPIFDENGNVTGAIIVFRNVSQEKESQALKSDFAYASHQLNTPVTKALWSIERALEENDSEKIKEKLSLAYQSTKSTEKLVRELLIVSEIDKELISLEIKKINMADFMDDLRKTIEKEENYPDLKIIFKPISPLLEINSDAKILKQALYEVIKNAIDYSKADGTVSITFDLKEDAMLIVIEDSGIGISPEQQALIFTKFFRGNNFDTTEVVGAGLGLFIAKEYIKLLKGKIWFESEEGKGTTFRITLPIK